MPVCRLRSVYLKLLRSARDECGGLCRSEGILENRTLQIWQRSL